MDISLVIPLLNEEESLPELSAWIEKVMLENNYTYEIIYVDDGSTDNSWEVIEQLRSKNPNITVHFTVHFNTLHYFFVIRFQPAIEIMQFYFTHLPGSRVK